MKKIDYNYDDDGNRTSVVVTPYGQSATTTSYTTNTLYEYTAVGGTTHTWDANGNLTNNGTHKFKYSYKNLICEVRLASTDALVATYKYDASGRRIEKAVSGGITERYVYSALETTSTYNGSNVWKQDFVFGQRIDEVLMLSQADVLDADGDSNTTETTRSFYHRNALGSVMEITEADQDVAVSYRYSPYGEPTITRNSVTQSSDPLQQHWTYTARFHDEETGSYHYRARSYSHAVGRFAQRDPRGHAEGARRYAYAWSRPLCLRDPLGEEPEEEKEPLPQGFTPFEGELPLDLPAGATIDGGDAAAHELAALLAGLEQRQEKCDCGRITMTLSVESVSFANPPPGANQTLLAIDAALTKGVIVAGMTAGGLNDQVLFNKECRTGFTTRCDFETFTKQVRIAGGNEFTGMLIVTLNVDLRIRLLNEVWDMTTVPGICMCGGERGGGAVAQRRACQGEVTITTARSW